MISFITCSIKPDLAERISRNITKTIGDNIEYEFLCIDNRNSNKGICQVYNDAAENAKGDILCFVHEDIEFKTQNWGSIIDEVFRTTKNIGILGVAGSTLISKTPAGWYNFHLLNENRFHILQQKNRNNGDSTFMNINPKNEILSKVVAVDGVIQFVKKNVWKEFRYDEVHFKGFHYYDIDFSARVSQRYSNYVSYSVLLEHFSQGNINKSWAKNALIFDKLWSDKLPLTIFDVNKKDLNKEEIRKLIHLLSNMLKQEFSFSIYITYVFRLFLIHPVLGLKYCLKRFI